MAKYIKIVMDPRVARDLRSLLDALAAAYPEAERVEVHATAGPRTGTGAQNRMVADEPLETQASAEAGQALDEVDAQVRSARPATQAGKSAKGTKEAKEADAAIGKRRTLKSTVTKLAK